MTPTENSALSWLVARVRPVHRLEFDVMHAFNQMEVPAMVPFEEKWIKRAKRKQRDKVKFPLFPCYVFVGLSHPDEFYSLKDAINDAAERRGKQPPILNLVGYGRRPAVLNPLEVQFLRRVSVEGATEVNLHKAIRAGSKIDILDGGFAGRTGTVDRVTKRSVFAMLEVFNTMQLVEISRANVAAA